MSWETMGTAPKSTTTPVLTPFKGHDVKAKYLMAYCPDEGVVDSQMCICIVWWEPHQGKDKRGVWVGEMGCEMRPTHWWNDPAWDGTLPLAPGKAAPS